MTLAYGANWSNQTDNLILLNFKTQDLRIKFNSLASRRKYCRVKIQGLRLKRQGNPVHVGPLTGYSTHLAAVWIQTLFRKD